ncbi:DUF4406 domain-containing protein [Patescibacteria group bacterium]|nr:DUF4406 domain-containing protein [Patescibacteria group bacterium]
MVSNYKNWTHEDLERVESVDSYEAMLDLALKILPRLGQPIAQVCGPLSTGGRGSFEKNLEMFSEGIEFLHNQGKIVFDQRPFEVPMQKLKNSREKGGYAFDLLDKFYLPVFESGYIKEMHFLPGWDGSTGAKWEHEQANRLGISIYYFPESFINNRQVF